MKQKILIIESDTKDRNAMAEILSIVGFKNVISAQTGKEGRIQLASATLCSRKT
jgi:ribosomal protein S5